MSTTLTLTSAQATRLTAILNQAHATSVNHLASSVLARPGEWHDMAPDLARQVETDRMLKLILSRAVTA